LYRRTVGISRKQKRKLGKTLPYIIPITCAAAFSAAEKAMILIASKKHNYSSMSVPFCVQYNLKKSLSLSGSQYNYFLQSLGNYDMAASPECIW